MSTDKDMLKAGWQWVSRLFPSIRCLSGLLPAYPHRYARTCARPCQGEGRLTLSLVGLAKLALLALLCAGPQVGQVAALCA